MCCTCWLFFFFFSSRRRHTRWTGDWSSDVCSSDLDEDLKQEDELALRGQVGLAGLEDQLGDVAHRAVHGHVLELVVDRKSTRLNSSHPSISYAVFCLKKKKK